MGGKLESEITLLSRSRGRAYVELRDSILANHRDAISTVSEDTGDIPNLVSILRLRINKPEESERFFRILTEESREHWDMKMHNPRPTDEKTEAFLTRTFGPEYTPIVEEYLLLWVSNETQGHRVRAVEKWFSKHAPGRAEKALLIALRRADNSVENQLPIIYSLTELGSKAALNDIRKKYDTVQNEELKAACFFFLAGMRDAKLQIEIEQRLSDAHVSEEELRWLLQGYYSYCGPNYYEEEINAYLRIPAVKVRKRILDGVRIYDDNHEKWASISKAEKNPELKAMIDSSIAEYLRSMQEIQESMDKER